MNTFVISTPTDDNRYKMLVTELEGQGLDINKDVEVFKAVMNQHSPQVGISESHRGVVQIAKNRNLPFVVILEDDIHFLSPFAYKRFMNIMARLPKDWELFFGNVYDGDVEEEYSGYAELKGKVSGLNMYCINASFYDSFLDADPAYNIDHWLSTVTMPKMYVCWPFLALQHDGFSYNRKEITNHNYNIGKKYKLYYGE